MNTVIYYFTGTGNSLKIARDISQNIPDSETRHIAAALAEGKDISESSEKVGIVFPVYVEGLPLIVERFVRNLKIIPGTYIFAVSNYGGSAGGSLLQMESLLAEKGAHLSAAFGLKMPDNTQILFPPSSEAQQRRDFEREASVAATIAHTVNEGAEAGQSLLRGASSWRRPQFDPAKMAENFLADEKCNGCAICEKICPVRNIQMDRTKPRWKDHCEQCLACMQWCPEKAIQFGTRTSGWGRYHHPEISVTQLHRPGRTFED